ncbi:hypothetical protein JTF08_05990 [Micrococcaceae bacterium RIT802]|nr:hypothetical protein [Micrococcaceae bacterium RIT 802]
MARIAALSARGITRKLGIGAIVGIVLPTVIFAVERDLGTYAAILCTMVLGLSLVALVSRIYKLVVQERQREKMEASVLRERLQSISRRIDLLSLGLGEVSQRTLDLTRAAGTDLDSTFESGELLPLEGGEKAPVLEDRLDELSMRLRNLLIGQRSLEYRIGEFGRHTIRSQLIAVWGRGLDSRNPLTQIDPGLDVIAAQFIFDTVQRGKFAQILEIGTTASTYSLAEALNQLLDWPVSIHSLATNAVEIAGFLEQDKSELKKQPLKVSGVSSWINDEVQLDFDLALVNCAALEEMEDSAAEQVLLKLVATKFKSAVLFGASAPVRQALGSRLLAGGDSRTARALTSDLALLEVLDAAVTRKAHP